MRRVLPAVLLMFASPVVLADEPAPAAEPTPDVVTPPTSPTPPTPPGPAPEPFPPLSLDGSPPKTGAMFSIGDEAQGFRISVPVRLSGRVEGTSPYAIDRYGNTDGGTTAVWPRARVGLIAELPPRAAPGGFRLRFEYEHDVVTGAVRFPDASVPILGGPDGTPLAQELRKAFVTVEDLPNYRVSAGVMTSHWGLGLVANDGDHGWTPGSARFTDPRSGDRVARLQLASAALGGGALLLTAAADWVLDDDVLLRGPEVPAGQGDDTAFQGVVAAVYGPGKPTTAGAYVVHRRQTTSDGRWLHATVIDLAGAHELPMLGGNLKLEGEFAGIVGDTTFAGTVDHPIQNVLQLGAGGRATLDLGGFGAVLDLVYATGDRNPDDGAQNQFRLDPNAEQGLVLFRHVEASQTGRGANTASDPNLVGRPANGVERLPSRGSIGNAIVIFPRANVRPMPGLEVYGGPLIAFAEVPQLDAFNSRLAGGAARNALDGLPTNYLGTELDVGARGRYLFGGVLIGVGLEAGLLLPGSVLASPTTTGAPVWSARALLDVQL